MYVGVVLTRVEVAFSSQAKSELIHKDTVMTATYLAEVSRGDAIQSTVYAAQGGLGSRQHL